MFIYTNAGIISEYKTDNYINLGNNIDDKKYSHKDNKNIDLNAFDIDFDGYDYKNFITHIVTIYNSLKDYNYVIYTKLCDKYTEFIINNNYWKIVYDNFLEMCYINNIYQAHINTFINIKYNPCTFYVIQTRLIAKTVRKYKVNKQIVYGVTDIILSIIARAVQNIKRDVIATFLINQLQFY